MKTANEAMFLHAERLYADAQEAAEIALIAEARIFLREHPEFDECVCAMGHLTFGNRDEDYHPKLGEFPARERYEAMFDQTYGPWRFKGYEGEIVRDW